MEREIPSLNFLGGLRIPPSTWLKMIEAGLDTHFLGVLVWECPFPLFLFFSFPFSFYSPFGQPHLSWTFDCCLDYTCTWYHSSRSIGKNSFATTNLFANTNTNNNSPAPSPISTNLINSRSYLVEQLRVGEINSCNHSVPAWQQLQETTNLVANHCIICSIV